MGYTYLLVLLSHLIICLKGELSLEIIKDVNGTEVPVNDTLQELAGTNLTLTCKLVTSGNTKYYFDDELSWGRKRKNVQFETVDDLKQLARDNSKPLHQFLEKGYPNEAVMQFHPLFLVDSGKYFCMSLKYNFFNVVQINVNVGVEDNELVTYFQAVDNSRLDFKFVDLNGPLSFPKFMCTSDMFICNSGTHCYDYKYVCDGVQDCNDGSDENIYLCGNDPCAGKKRCSGGRCISPSLCCDKFRDPYCTVSVKPACCSENDEKYLNDGLPAVIPSHDDGYDFSNEWNKHDVEVQTIWKNNEEKPRIETLWIVVPCIIILILVIVCIMARQFVMTPANRRSTRSPHCTLSMPVQNTREVSLVSGRTSPASGRISALSGRISPMPMPGNLRQGSVNSARTSPSPYYNINGSTISRSVSPNMIPHYDLPPSYDEAVANSRPNASPLRE